MKCGSPRPDNCVDIGRDYNSIKRTLEDAIQDHLIA